MESNMIPEQPSVSAAPPVATGAQPEDMDEQPNVSPEEQKTYDATMTAALNVIYSEKGFPAVIAKLASFKDNIKLGIGHTAAMILIAILQRVEEDDKTIPDDILFAAGQEIISDLLRIAEGSNLIEAGQAESLAEPAFYEGMKVFGQWMNDNGRITPDVKAQAEKDLAEGGHQVPGQQSAAPPTSNQPPPAAPPAGGIVNQALGV